MAINVLKGPIKVDKETLEEVSRFTYLGRGLCSDSDTMLDIKQRISKAANSFHKHRDLSLTQKYKCLTTASCLSSFMEWRYGNLQQTLIRRSTYSKIKCLQKFFSVHWKVSCKHQKFQVGQTNLKHQVSLKTMMDTFRTHFKDATN